MVLKVDDDPEGKEIKSLLNTDGNGQNPERGSLASWKERTVMK